MKQHDIVIVYLSLSLLVVQWFWLRSVKHEAYLEGRQSVYDSFAATAGDGICYANSDDCLNNPNGK